VVADPKALKPYKTYPDQLAQLEGRGLTVADRSAALAALQRLGYYRLSGYFYALRKTNPVGKPGRQNDFETGASFELVVALADFDKRLRLLALDAIESVEIAVRVAIAYRLGKFDPLAHLQPRLLDGRFTQQRPGQAQSRHQDWIARFEEQCSKSREEFMQHHREVYGGQVPIWAARPPHDPERHRPEDSGTSVMCCATTASTTATTSPSWCCCSDIHQDGAREPGPAASWHAHTLPDYARWPELSALRPEPAATTTAPRCSSSASQRRPADRRHLRRRADQPEGAAPPGAAGQGLDGIDWFSAAQDGLGDLYEGLLEKNASETKSGAGQYFTPRPLIDTIIASSSPSPARPSKTRPPAPAAS
jgi:hypothetical protein